MTWIRISINATHEAVDWVTTLLAARGYRGEMHLLPVMTPSQESQPGLKADGTAWAARIHLYLPNQPYVQPHVEQIKDWLSSLIRIGEITINSVAIAQEEERAAEVSIVTRIGNRFVIVPPSHSYSAQADEIVLILEPDLAFGSGLHPATVLALRSLESTVRPGMTVLDFGSGTGILSVAMARLGATVVALDNDRSAVEATRRTVHHNTLESQITVMEGSLGTGSQLGHWMGGKISAHVPTLTPDGNFDLIATNNLARVHIALADDFRAALRQDQGSSGLLITSGFTTEYEHDVNVALHSAGFAALSCERSDEWVALTHQRT